MEALKSIECGRYDQWELLTHSRSPHNGRDTPIRLGVIQCQANRGVVVLDHHTAAETLEDTHDGVNMYYINPSISK